MYLQEEYLTMVKNGDNLVLTLDDCIALWYFYSKKF